MSESTKVPSGKVHKRFIVTWQINHDQPRQFDGWLDLEGSEGKIRSLLLSHKDLGMDSWSEYPTILESIDSHYRGNTSV